MKTDGIVNLKAPVVINNLCILCDVVDFDIDGEPRDLLPDLGADEYFDPGSIRQVYLPLIARISTSP